MLKSLQNIRDLHLSEKLVYRALLQSGTLTKNEIIERAGGSLSSVYRLLNNLVQAELIAVSNSQSTGTGRTPITYRINPEAGYTFSAYLRWDIFGLGLCAIDGSILAKTEWILTEDTKPADFVDRIKEYTDLFLTESGVPRSKLLGLCLSTTGPLLKEKGILYYPFHIDSPHWEVIPIKDLLEMATGFTVTVNNLACTALVGEMMRGKTDLSVRSAYIFIDYGLGTDIFIPGMLEMDIDDHSGTLGAMVVDIHGKRKTMGDYVNISGIHSLFREQYPDEPSLLLPEIAPSELWDTSPELAYIRTIMDRSGDVQNSKYESFIQKISFVLGVGFSNFINLLQPKVVYYGGRIVRQLPEIVDKATEQAVSSRLPGMLTSVEFRESNCNEELFILGGMYQTLDKLIGLVRPVFE